MNLNFTIQFNKMATVPSTIVIFSEDRTNFPTKWLLLVTKQLFQYGVKDMKIKGEKIFLSLSYSPKAITLKKKFGNLPVRYMRVKIDKEEDFKVLETIVKRYRFNILDEEMDQIPQKRLEASDSKRKFCIEPPESVVLDLSDEDDDGDNFAATTDVPNKKRKINEGPSTSSTAAVGAIVDNSFTDILSQPFL